jgi:hypothetical protein
MHPILAVCLAVAIVVAPPSMTRAAVASVPDEPGVLVLPDPTIQAVVADLDGRGSRDVVRLVAGAGGSQLLEVWREARGTWARLGDGVEVIAPEIARFDAVHDPGPARLIVRTDGARERVAIVRQPSFDPPSLEPECCLEVHDVVPAPGGVELRPVGSAPAAVDAILALDLDGDGTDELLASRSLRPLGRTAYPSEALVFRWNGDRFGTPTLTELPVGSGNTPFVLGESDGVAGDEAGLITTAARSVLYRIVLDADDRVRAENAGMVVGAVAAVPLGDGPGVAVVGAGRSLTVHRWPSGDELGPPLGQRAGPAGRIIGSVDRRGDPYLLLAPADDASIEPLRLPDLQPLADVEVASPAAESVRSSTPLRPFRGVLPGGGPDGAPAVLFDGILAGHDDEPRQVASLADAHPIGLAGPGTSWLALAHGMGDTAPDPAGGRLERIGVPVAGTVSLVPGSLALAPERDGGALDPELRDAFVLEGGGTLGISPSGFGALVRAPAGSRVHAAAGDGSVLGVQPVPRSGRLEVRLSLLGALLPSDGDRAWIAVATPGGATYLSSWSVLALAAAPPLDARSRTVLGDPGVEIRGATVPYASVSVDGRAVDVGSSGAFAARVNLPPWPTDVEVVASDPVGNATAMTVVGIGLLDYRGLPLIPITLAALAAVAAILYVRGPRPGRRAAWAGPDASLEELDPDGEL